jgi:hypothetical protein
MVLQLRTNCEIKYEWMDAQLMSLSKYPMCLFLNIQIKKKTVEISKMETFKYVLKKIAKNC